MEIRIIEALRTVSGVVASASLGVLSFYIGAFLLVLLRVAFSARRRNQFLRLMSRPLDAHREPRVALSPTAWPSIRQLLTVIRRLLNESPDVSDDTARVRARVS
jgi:hypothetical protein